MNGTDAEEIGYIKVIVIIVVLISNIVVNALAIAVLARYPELREDRTALFMISMSVSDLAMGCLAMPISAAVCSNTTPSMNDMHLPDIHMFFMWCFSFNSLHSLCWLTVSKLVTLLKPLRHEVIFTRRRCYGVIACNWIIGALIAASRLGMGAAWNMISCTSALPKTNAVSVVSLLIYAVAIVLPGVALVCSTLGILGVVVRVHATMSTQVHAFDGSDVSAGHVTLKAVRSAKTVLIICAVSVALALPLLPAIVLRHATDNKHLTAAIGFAAVWMFTSNTVMNSLLYLLLYRSVRRKMKLMFTDVCRFLHNL